MMDSLPELTPNATSKPSKHARGRRSSHAAKPINTTHISDTLLQELCETIYDHVKDEKGKVSKDTFITDLEDLGILRDDPRITGFINSFAKCGSLVEKDACINCISKNISVVENAFTNSNVIEDFKTFASEVKDLFYEVKANNEGKLNDSKSNKFIISSSSDSKAAEDYFGLALCTIDGQRLRIGDTDVKYCVQHCSKPINYCLGLEEYGVDEIHKYVGREPSGSVYNALKLNKQGLPHNPLVNSGAIMMCSLIKKKMEPAERYDYILKVWEQLAGGKKLGYSNSAYLSEKITADRNFALAYFMKENHAFPPKTNITDILDFYIQCCSLLVNTDQLSIVAGTLANGGVCPLTGKQVISAESVQYCLSIMYSCGLYDYSGEFAFRFGLPAQSGAAGAILTVIPNVMGICSFSPKLDQYGNSVRGVDFFSRLTNKFNFHLFSNMKVCGSSKKNPRKETSEDVSIEKIIHYSSLGDVGALKRLRIKRTDFSKGDYDRRTPLHLAASNGHLEVVKYLLVKGGLPEVNPLDRWGGTPYDDATREGHMEVINFLTAAGAVSGSELHKDNRDLLDFVKRFDAENTYAREEKLESTHTHETDKKHDAHIHVAGSYCC